MIPVADSRQLLHWLQTDQYMDPWRDVALSLNPSTRDRHVYAAGNPIGFVDTNGHVIVNSDSEQLRPATPGCGMNEYKCGDGSTTVQKRADTVNGCGCTRVYPGTPGGTSAISYGGETIVASAAKVRNLESELAAQQNALAVQRDGFYSYLADTNAACDSRWDRWFGATCQAYQQGSLGVLHRLDLLEGRRVGFKVTPGPSSAWIATTGSEVLGGSAISLGRGLLRETTSDPLYAVARTVNGASLIIKGSMLSGVSVAVGTYQDGTNGFAKSSISVAASAGVTAAASSSRYCGRIPNKFGAGACSLGVGFGAGWAAGATYDEVREATK